MCRRRCIARALHLTCHHFLEHTITSLLSSQQNSQRSALLIGCNSSPDLSLLQPGFGPMWLDEYQFWSLINTSSLQHLTQWTPPFMTIFFSWSSGHHIFQSPCKPLLLTSFCLFCETFLISSIYSHLIAPTLKILIFLINEIELSTHIITLHSYSHMIFDKEAKNAHWREDNIVNKWCW